jgi:DNA-binding response OmpR family regulator
MTPPNNTEEARTVFLVNEDSSAGSLYSRGLEQAGFRTASAFSKETACEALPNLSADLIILDLMLPKRGGFQLLEAIRADIRHKDTPVLVISNTYLPEMTQRALRAGSNAAVPRSECTSSDLIAVSRELVRITRASASGCPATEDSFGQNPVDEPSGHSLGDQLRKDLIEEGGNEVAAIRQYCLKFVELTGKEARNIWLKYIRAFAF